MVNSEISFPFRTESKKNSLLEMEEKQMKDDVYERDEIVDVLMAISVVARRLARNLAILQKGEKHESNERNGNSAERTKRMCGCNYPNNPVVGRSIHRY